MSKKTIEVKIDQKEPLPESPSSVTKEALKTMYAALKLQNPKLYEEKKKDEDLARKLAKR